MSNDLPTALDRIAKLEAALGRVLIEEQRLPRADPPWHMFVFDHATFLEFAELVEDLDDDD